MLARNENLRQIDLSSLETISGGGVLSFNNPQLCYVGNLTTYLDGQTTQHQCIISPFRRDPQECSESCVVPPLLHNATLVLIGPTSSLLSWCLADVIHVHELLTNLILLFNLKLAVNTWRLRVKDPLEHIPPSLHAYMQYNVLPYSVYVINNVLHVHSSLVNDSFICHEQCDSVTSCWGSNDTQCEGCRNFRYLRRCVENCSVVSLPANSRWGSTSGRVRVWECESVIMWVCVRECVWVCECECVRVWLCVCWWITCWLHEIMPWGWLMHASNHYPALYAMSGVNLCCM